jgi:hypothetical protein
MKSFGERTVSGYKYSPWCPEIHHNCFPSLNMSPEDDLARIARVTKVTACYFQDWNWKVAFDYV